MSLTGLSEIGDSHIINFVDRRREPAQGRLCRTKSLEEPIPRIIDGLPGRGCAGGRSYAAGTLRSATGASSFDMDVLQCRKEISARGPNRTRRGEGIFKSFARR